MVPPADCEAASTPKLERGRRGTSEVRPHQSNSR